MVTLVPPLSGPALGNTERIFGGGHVLSWGLSLEPQLSVSNIHWGSGVRSVERHALLLTSLSSKNKLFLLFGGITAL